MITLNSDKGLVNIETWDDVISRPGFTNDLNPQQHTLKAILGRYMLKDPVNCGLSECHTLHGKGYLVLTTDALETNIGHACGKKYFGVDFETLSRKMDRDITEKNNRETLVTFSFRAEEVWSRITSYREGESGAKRIHGFLRPLRVLSSGCPEPVVSNVLRMIKARTASIATSREATAKEYDRLDSLGSAPVARPHYIEEVVGNLDGIEALFPENDLQVVLVKDLEERLKDFELQDIDSMSFESLRSWVKWTSVVDANLDRVEQILSAARRLLTQKNLRPLDVFVQRDDDKALFKQYLQKLPLQ